MNIHGHADDGYSPDAQKARMRAYAEFNGYEIAGEYEDAGKSGKSIFDKLYSVMEDFEKRQLLEALISEIQIHEEQQPNGQWLKSIKFKLPIIEEDMSLSLDDDSHVETILNESDE